MADVTTHTVEFQSDNFTIRAFLARPADGQDPLPAVIVLQEWWGLTDHIKDVVQRFAQEGFVAFAPDLYSRQGYQVTTDPEEAAQLMNALSSQAVLRDLNAATGYLKTQAFVDPERVGMVGFCMGGTFTLTQATHNSDVKAAVPFYGKVPPIEPINYLLCPILYHYGAKDSWVTRKEVEQLAQGLERYGKTGTVQTYQDADHAFFNDTRPDVYSPVAAKVAWERTVAFLKEYLT